MIPEETCTSAMLMGISIKEWANNWANKSSASNAFDVWPSLNLWITLARPFNESLAFMCVILS
jgi:hypothetical protein